MFGLPAQILPPENRSRGSHRLTLASILAASVVVALMVTGSAPIAAAPAAPSKVSSGWSTSAPSYPALYQLPFAERAGYVGALVDAVAHPVALSANVTIVVTFEPRSASFFSPPVGGTDDLSTSEVADAYGLSVAQYATAINYFAGFGLTVVHTWPDRLSLTLQGSAVAVGAAFDTHLFSGVYAHRSVRYPDPAPALPGAIGSEVSAVVGLSEGFMTFSLPLTTTSSPSPDGAGSLVYPSAVHTIYDFNGLYNYSGTPHWATGVGIVLLLWGAGYSPDDVNTFFSQYYPAGFPALTLEDFPVDGAPPPSANAVTDPSHAPEELTLDMEWSGSEAPGATLKAVYAPDGPAGDNYSPTDASMEDALNTAMEAAGNVSVISMSFGSSDGNDSAFQLAWDQDFAEAGQKGITLLAASGDNGGSYGSCGSIPDPEYPAASPYVIAVGGSSPDLNYVLGKVSGLSSETAWDDSGGGYSNTYDAPYWQLVGSAKAPIAAHGHRGIPDVAGAAANNFLFYNGQAQSGEGTSFATPLWAGLIAEMDAIRGSSFGFITPRLYAVGSAEANATDAIGLSDITSGSNCLYHAVAGWDPVTGWGSPRGLLLYEDLTSTYVDLAIATGSSNVAPGSGIAVSARILNVTSHQPIPGIPVALTLASIGYSTPCGGTFGSATATTNATGWAEATLTVPDCYLGPRAEATALLSADGYFGSNSTDVGVNLIGLSQILQVLTESPFNVAGFILIMVGAGAVGFAWDRRQRRRRRRTSASQGASPSAAGGEPPPESTETGSASAEAPVLRPMGANAWGSVPPPPSETLPTGPPTSEEDPRGPPPELDKP